jgi:hypothetical protein
VTERPGVATLAAGAVASLVLLVGLLAGASASALGALTGGSGGGSGGPPTASAVGAIPSAYLALYQAAAATCPGLPWSVLAAIGTVESANGTSTLPGVSAGQNAAGAMVIYRWVGGLRHVRDSVFGRRACGVSASCEVRGAGGDGHTRSLGCPGCDGLLSGVACGVSF